MADIQKTIEILFLGRDELTAVIQDVAEGFETIEAIAAPFRDIADAILKMDAALIAMSAGGMAAAYAKSGEFQTASKDLEKVLNEEAARIREAEEAAKSLSAAYGKSAGEVLETMAVWKQAGFTLDESLGLTENSIRLSIAGGMTLKESAENLVGTLKGFEASAADAVELIDIWNEVSNNFATDARQLSKAMADASPIAKQLGMDYKETAALLTPIIEVFRSGSEAAVAFRNGAMKLVTDQTPVKEALNVLEVSQRDLNDKMRSGKDILFDVMKAYQGLEPSMKAVIAMKLVDIEQSARMLTVFDGLNKVLDIQKTAMDSAGSAAKEVAIRLESADVTVNRMKEAFNNLAISIGQQYLDAASKALEATTGLQDAIRKSVDADAFKTIFDFIDKQIAAYKQTIALVTENLPEALKKVDFSELTQALEKAVGDIKNILGGIDISTPEGLAAALQRSVDAMTNFIHVSRGIAGEMSPLFRVFDQIIEKSGEMNEKTALEIGELLGKAKLIADAGVIVGSALIAIGNDADKAKAVFELVLGSMETVWNSFQVTFDLILLGVSEFMKRLFEITSAAAGTKTGEKALEWLGFSTLKKDIDDAIANLEDFQKAVKPDLVQQSRETLAGLERAIDGVAGKAGTAKTAMDAVAQKFTDIPAKKEITFSATMDEEALKRVQDRLNKWVLPVIPEVDKKKLEDDLKKDPVKLPVIPDVDSAGLLQAAADVKNIQSEGGKLNIVFEGISATIEGVGKALREFTAGTAADFAAKELFESIKKSVEEETVLRKQQVEYQAKQVAVYERIIALKEEAVKGGMKLIVNADHLAPHLEMVWFHILEAMQVRINEEGADALIGL